MSQTVYSKEENAQHSEESILWGVDFTGALGTTDTLTGSPTASIFPVGPTVGSPSRNASTFLNGDGETVAISKGVQVRVSGLTAGVNYKLKTVCGTTGGNTLVVLNKLRCEE